MHAARVERLISPRGGDLKQQTCLLLLLLHRSSDAPRRLIELERKCKAFHVQCEWSNRPIVVQVGGRPLSR